jgi:hypothetical protein
MSYIGNQPVYQAFVTDQFSGNGSTTAFTMSVAPANTASVLVAVSGVLQDPSTYSVSGTTLTFSAAPPSGTGNISARYLGIPASGVTTTAYRTVTEFTATAGQTTFTPPSYTVGYINVYRNGVRLGSADYTATNGTTVVLATGATAGDIVTVESYYVSSVVGAIPAVAGAVTNTYLLDGSVSQSKLATGVGGTGPAFSASISGTQTVTTNTFTKVAFDTKNWDTATCFNTSTYRFTPNVAGYYLVTGSIDAGGTASNLNRAISTIYKNGSAYRLGENIGGNGSYITPYTGMVSAQVYLNGSTDYIELYGYVAGTTTTISVSSATWFDAVLVRAA